MPEAPALRLRTTLLAIGSCIVLGYALYEEFATEPPLQLPAAADVDDSEPEKLRIVSVQPGEAPPGAAVFVRFEGAEPDRLDEIAVHSGKEPLQVLQKRADQLVVRIPSQAPYGQIKLRVTQGERRSKPWVMTLQPLPRHRMLRDFFGGLALFALGLRTVSRALRAYAGQRVRSLLGRMTRAPLVAALWGVLAGSLAQGTTASAALFAGLLDARMVEVRRASFLLVGSQLGAAFAAVLLPLFAPREALWLISIGVLGLFVARSRLSRALASSVIGAGLIFHGLSLLQAGCAPLISDPLILPYLWDLQARGLGGALLCCLAGAAMTAVLQSPAPLFALLVSLLQQEVLGLREALAMLCGVSLGAIANTAAATWAYSPEARRLVRVELMVAPIATAVGLAGLSVWERLPELAPASFAFLGPVPRQLGTGFIALAFAGQLVAGLVLWQGGRRRWATGAPRASLTPVQPTLVAYTQALLQALEHCRTGLAGVRDIIASADRSSAPSTEGAIMHAQQLLRGLLRSPALDPNSGLQASSVAALHLADTLISTLRIAEKAPELGLRPSGEAARALEHLHSLLDSALETLCRQLEAGDFPSLSEAQAREIEINAAEAESRRRLFASQSSGDELAVRIWSSELCSAYESIGNQVYRAVSAFAAEEDN
jgi:Na+/phosphate symporter